MRAGEWMLKMLEVGLPGQVWEWVGLQVKRAQVSHRQAHRGGGTPGCGSKAKELPTPKATNPKAWREEVLTCPDFKVFIVKG